MARLETGELSARQQPGARARLELGTPVRLRIEARMFDVTADGRRFLVDAPVPGSTSSPTVVLNWSAELRP